MSSNYTAVCGLYCKACIAYIATEEEPERLAALAKRFGVTPEEMKCDGCHSNRRSAACKSCEFIACAQTQGVSYCGECGRYPCEKLQAFIEKLPHRAEILTDHVRIRTVGREAWEKEAAVRNACPKCGVLNCAYDLTCRKCGADPSSAFVETHGAKIRAHLERVNNQ